MCASCILPYQVHKYAFHINKGEVGCYLWYLCPRIQSLVGGVDELVQECRGLVTLVNRVLERVTVPLTPPKKQSLSLLIFMWKPSGPSVAQFDIGAMSATPAYFTNMTPAMRVQYFGLRDNLWSDVYAAMHSLCKEEVVGKNNVDYCKQLLYDEYDAHFNFTYDDLLASVDRLRMIVDSHRIDCTINIVE